MKRTAKPTTPALNSSAKQVHSGYFQTSYQRLHDIAAQGGGALELSAYLVLCGGVSNTPGCAPRTSTHGAPSVATRTGQSRHGAEEALKWLETHGFIQKAAPSTQHRSSDPRAPRWIVDPAVVPDLAIAQPFLDAPTRNEKTESFTAKAGTLAALWTSPATADDIPFRNGITDALLVFLGLHQRHDLASYAGVDPAAIFGRCTPIEDGADGPGTQHKRMILNQRWVLVTEQRPESLTPSKSFVQACLGSIEPWEGAPSLSTRFQYALAQLQRLQLVLPAMVLWDANPVDRSHGRDPSVLGTLHTNAWMTDDAPPRLFHLIHQFLMDAGIVDSVDVFADSRGESAVWNGSGNFRYIVDARSAPYVTLLQQVRPRWVPLNTSWQEGIAAEKQRYEQWLERSAQWKALPQSQPNRAPESVAG